MKWYAGSMMTSLTIWLTVYYIMDFWESQEKIVLQLLNIPFGVAKNKKIVYFVSKKRVLFTMRMVYNKSAVI